MKASINFQKSQSTSTEHMNRTSKTNYLILPGRGVDYKLYSDKQKYLEFAKIQTKLKTKRKMQKKAEDNFIQEAVINIKQNTNIKDIESLFSELNKKYGGGFKVFEIALHKDEGVFIRTMENLNIDELEYKSDTMEWFDKDNKNVSDKIFVYRPNKDVFYNSNDKKWYYEKSFKNEFNISSFQIKMKMNYHAHVNFTKFDEATGKNIRLSKKDMSDIQTLTAEHLNMTRGKKWSKTKRMTHYQRKAMSDNINSQKINNFIKLKKTVSHLK